MRFGYPQCSGISLIHVAMALPLQFFGVVLAEDVHRAVWGLRDLFERSAVVDITDAESCWWMK